MKSSVFSRYPATIWVRIVGTILSKICEFMIVSFMGFYLYEKLGQNIASSAFIATLGPLTGIVFGTIGAGLSDRFGRKPIMVIGISVQALTFFGYIFADNYFQFIGLSIFGGLAPALYWPSANAQIADLIDEKRRGEVYALMHSAINAGAAFGPLLGLAAYRTNPKMAFALAAAGLLIYAALLFFKTVESAPFLKIRSERQKKKALAHFFDFFRFPNSKTLFLLTLFTIPVGVLYSQCSLILPLHLKKNFTNYHEVFAWLVSFNGLCCMLFSVPVQKIFNSYKINRVVLWAYLLLGATALGYGFSFTIPLIFITEFIFTLGEMMNGPQIQRLVALIAEPQLRARFFTINSMSWNVSGVFGPNLAAYFFNKIGGEGWFTILGIVIFIAGIGQFFLIRFALKTKLPIQSV